MESLPDLRLTASHWGIGVARVEDGRLTEVRAHPIDADPSPLNANLPGSLNGPARVRTPAIRESWLKGESGVRGQDRFVELRWTEALDIIAERLSETIARHGNQAIFAGSYGWASAGRFHHAQSQLKRFLNTLGGFVRSEGNYSFNAALVALPHITGGSYRDHILQTTRWKVIARHSDLVVLFGGHAMRNTQICDGGLSRHRVAEDLRRCVEAGVSFVNVSPLRSDAPDFLGAQWLPARPGSDVALMMGLAHTLLEEGLQDDAFLDRYTTGFDLVRKYLTGESEGVAKSADWAAEQTGLAAPDIRALARRMAQGRTIISCAVSLQRADWGEQALWMTVTLAAMLGQIGLPGGGYGVGYAMNGHIGSNGRPFRWTPMPQGRNPVDAFIPVAMISDMLLNPGSPFRYNGETYRFPDIRMVWWAGGNPFHHHQDLNRLRAAFQRPETIIVNEINWTSTARHADIVLPVAAPQERTDIGGGRQDNILVPMRKCAEPPGAARIEYDIYTELARRLGTEAAFTEGRDCDGWLRFLWDSTRQTGASLGYPLPDWETFLAGGPVTLDDPAPDQVFLADFRADPVLHPRSTPSGRIELFSETVVGFGLAECAGHATWNPPRYRTTSEIARYPLVLVSGQPATRLHSQHDTGAYSLSHKVAGREPVLIHPDDAARRGLADGDVVEMFNDRGVCLAGARLCPDIMQGVVFLWTGAWFDPDFTHPRHRDRHGNPNVLTHDLRTSEFSQGPASHSACIEIRRADPPIPEVTAHRPPVRVLPVEEGPPDD
jgi:biotin/methionine sulfoxide reductase